MNIILRNDPPERHNDVILQPKDVLKLTFDGGDGISIKYTEGKIDIIVVPKYKMIKFLEGLPFVSSECLLLAAQRDLLVEDTLFGFQLSKIGVDELEKLKGRTFE
jgi:hypothetical protein